MSVTWDKLIVLLISWPSARALGFKQQERIYEQRKNFDPALAMAAG
jgi:hypothetical protein